MLQGMKYEIDRLGEGGQVYIEQQDIEAIGQGRDPQTLELYLRYRKNYDDTGCFRWNGKSLILPIVPRHIRRMADQSREAQAASSEKFCTNCFDYGKVHHAPKGCFRCQLLEASMKAGLGDMRKKRPDQPERTNGLCIALLMLVAAFWGAMIWVSNLTTRNMELESNLAAARAGYVGATSKPKARQYEQKKRIREAQGKGT